MFNKVAAVFFHLSPIVPFALGYRFTGMALVLLVGLAYVKTFKLNGMINDKSGATSSGSEQDIHSLQRTRDFWQRLTFL